MEIMTVKEVALYLNCSRTTIYKMIRNKAIPFYKTESKYNFEKDIIDQWKQEQYVNERS